MIIFLTCWLLIHNFNSLQSQYVYQSLTVVSSQGIQYSPINPSAQFISSTIVDSFKLCVTACNLNTFCRVFDYGALVDQQCRLFEGGIGTLGTIVPSSIPDSRIGSVTITPSLFTQYGQSCSSTCTNSRYLTCTNSTCQCMPHTYWNSTVGICLPQSPILGVSCQQGLNMCRQDLNYTCLQFNQCGPLSVLAGTTVIDQNTTINGSVVGSLNIPWGISIYEAAENESLAIVDYKLQVILMNNVNSNNPTVSSIIRNWIGGDNFSTPFYARVDTQNANNLYVSDYGNSRVVLFSSMQINNPLPRVVAGVNKTYGSNLNQFAQPNGIAVDKRANLYIDDGPNNRVVRWAPNATAGVIIAGRGVVGNDSMSFNSPLGIYLDENNSLLYVADSNNHRIQLYHLNGTPPYNGTTVAGGNGPGLGSHQLNFPCDVWVSKKTGTIYIIDRLNSRVQRWSKDATSGVTLAGSPNGNTGSLNTLLYRPAGIAINANETRMYVSETGNTKVQRFDLISLYI